MSLQTRRRTYQPNSRMFSPTIEEVCILIATGPRVHTHTYIRCKSAGLLSQDRQSYYLLDMASSLLLEYRSRGVHRVRPQGAVVRIRREP